ncbi:hypothetical protein BIV59_22190 [Bacillus sp. MUM 13]|nr:hypothetical protein BIV59_22190 [Bacillus sp. MUM 13]
MPTDLDGHTVLRYENRSDDNFNAAVNIACRAITRKINELGVYQDPVKLLAEAQISSEQDYAIIRLLRKLTTELLANPENKYHYLAETVWSAYKIPNSFTVEGIGVWKAEKEGLRQIAGNEGRGRFFEFGVNNNLQENRIIVMDCYMKSEELILEKSTSPFDKTYVLCYPIGKHVLAVAVTGREKLSKEVLSDINEQNYKLLGTINDLFGGAST